MKMIILVSGALIAAAPAVAQQDHAHDSAAQTTGHEASPSAGQATPMAGHGVAPVPVNEGGQATFAAITEIISKLDADPATDWSKVDIESVRRHLVDMDNVTMRTDVVAATIAGGVRFVVTAHDARARESLVRMVGLHSAMANEEGRFRYSSSVGGGKVTVTVTAVKAEDVARVRAIGFHGLLTEGVHHQRHHWAMARGVKMH